MWETLRDPELGRSEEANEAPICNALGMKVPLYEWSARPEQALYRKNFGIGMAGLAAAQQMDVILDGMLSSTV